jgi:trk system potassium uptake protein
VAFIDRFGQALVPDDGTVLQQGDVLHVIAREENIERITAALMRGEH